jgi:hypothetical protein
MTKRRICPVCLVCVLAALTAGAAGYFVLEGRRPAIGAATPAGCRPSIRPDYSDTIIPPNIAPLNFVLTKPGKWNYLEVSSAHGEPIKVWSRDRRIVIPIQKWHKLLESNRGQQLRFDISIQGQDGQWISYEPIVNTIAKEEIDSHLAYRLMNPFYSYWRNIDVYQRDLTGFKQSPILRSKSVGNGCVNCHTFRRNSPADMIMNVRSGQVQKIPGGMVLVRDNAVTGVVNTKTAFNPIPAIYLSWHPSGKLIAFSSNKVDQLFHSVGEDREVFDHRSDLGLYRLADNSVTTSGKVSQPGRMETYPEWSPDGKYLYFCSAPQVPIAEYKQVRYDLMRIGYDIETNTWGEVETVLSSSDTKLSVTHPRISPDGRWLLFCMCQRGNFSIWRPDSDLYMMDLGTGKYKRLDINSDRSESWHCWSSNGRWIVFGSKRDDGLFAKPYFSYVDQAGEAHKPFLLPQADPTFYDSFIKTYNVPQFITGPVRVTQRQLAKAAHSAEAQIKAKLDPRLEVPKTPGPTTQDGQYEPGPAG